MDVLEFLCVLRARYKIQVSRLIDKLDYNVCGGNNSLRSCRFDVGQIGFIKPRHQATAFLSRHSMICPAARSSSSRRSALGADCAIHAIA